MSSGATGLGLVLTGAALLLMPERPRIRRPARGLRPFAAPSRPRLRAAVGTSALAVAGVALLPAFWWAVLLAATTTGVVIARRPYRRSAAGRDADRRLLAVHAELFASCLDAGMATGTALLAVSDVLGGSTGGPASAGPSAVPGGLVAEQPGPYATLDAVAAMLSLGADPATAWRVIDVDNDLAPLAAAALRSAAGGGGLADAVREFAAQLRLETASASVRAAGRAGVLMAAPLGVCFLPAFLCLGLAPVVVGLLGQLQIF